MAKKPVRHESDKVGAALKALLETRPEAWPSLLEEVARHLELIEKLLERGHSFGRIVDALQQVGMDIKENTLRIYVGRLRRQATQARNHRLRRPAAEKPPGASPRKVTTAVKLAVSADGTRQVKEPDSWLTEEPDETKI